MPVAETALWSDRVHHGIYLSVTRDNEPQFMREMRITLRPSSFVDFALTARVLRRSPRNLIDRVDDDWNLDARGRSFRRPRAPARKTARSDDHLRRSTGPSRGSARDRSACHEGSSLSTSTSRRSGAACGASPALPSWLAAAPDCVPSVSRRCSRRWRTASAANSSRLPLA